LPFALRLSKGRPEALHASFGRFTQLTAANLCATTSGEMGEVRSVTASDGVRLAVHVTGGGPPVYVIHGGPANDHTGFGDHLAPVSTYAELCLLDQRGCGDSEDAPANSYTLG